MNSLIEHIIASSEMHLKARKRVVVGQFFTPSSIAKFMAKLCSVGKHQESIRILDPGAGAGILAACLCVEVAKKEHIKNIHVDLYENDSELYETILANMTYLKKELPKSGTQLTFNLFCSDFILSNSKIWTAKLASNCDETGYDVAISNPPYLKINKQNPVSSLMSEIVHGQPNMYMFFMAMAAELLKKDGQLIFITPRSYCSGLYFKAFRKWFFANMKPTRIHIFESRKKAFDNKVLQETIILKAIRTNSKKRTVTITSSNDADFKNNVSMLKSHPYETLISNADPEYFMKLPTSKKDAKTLGFVNGWQNTLISLGFKLSTGPVVDFRSKQFLLERKKYNGKESAPLFWMQNIKGVGVEWPLPNGAKASTIKISQKSLSRLVKNNNYVFVKRFTSKEQRKRVYAATYRSRDFKTDFIGIENHLNFIWKLNGESMTEKEAYGIMALLNSPTVDRYFRIVSGSTQVNANEINNMPVPNLEQIIKIGENFLKRRQSSKNNVELTNRKCL